jgi:hypothetical protein
VEKMLQDDQVTWAPRAVRVSIKTAVWMVMCSEISPTYRVTRCWSEGTYEGTVVITGREEIRSKVSDCINYNTEGTRDFKLTPTTASEEKRNWLESASGLPPCWPSRPPARQLTASTLERLSLAKLLTKVHESGHLVLGENNLLATPCSEGTNAENDGDAGNQRSENRCSDRVNT